MKWEYKVVYINARKWTRTGLPAGVNDLFDELGKLGWELVKIEANLHSGFMLFGCGWFTSTAGYHAFF